MSGAAGYTAIAEYGRAHKQLRAALGFTYAKTPCAATFYNVFRALDIQAFSEKLTAWVSSALSHFLPLEGGLTGVAIDGKTLRLSKRMGAKRAHLLSVVSPRVGGDPLTNKDFYTVLPSEIRATL